MPENPHQSEADRLRQRITLQAEAARKAGEVDVAGLQQRLADADLRANGLQAELDKARAALEEADNLIGRLRMRSFDGPAGSITVEVFPTCIRLGLNPPRFVWADDEGKLVADTDPPPTTD